MIAIRASTIALCSAAALAVAVPVWLLWPPVVLIEDAPRAKVTPLRIAAVGSLDAVLTAPLFNPERAPPPSPEALAAAAMPVPPLSPAPQLVGTIAGGRLGGVVLVKTTNGETVTVTLGQNVDGWRLLRIGNGQAQFQQGDRSETVALDFRNKLAAGGAPVALQAPNPALIPVTSLTPASQAPADIDASPQGSPQ